MHESTVTQSMLLLAFEHANGRRITDIYLDVGKMSFIVPEGVQSYFDFLSVGTQAEGAKLHFEEVPLEMTCLDCSQLMDLSEWADDRPQLIMQKAFAQACHCGSKNLRVTGGLGFDLVSIDVDETG